MSQAFAMDSLPVTNGEFSSLLLSGGYDERAAIGERRIGAGRNLEKKQHPTGWCKQDHAWSYRAMFDSYRSNKWLAGRST